MKFYFLFLLLREREERHRVEKGEERRKKRGISRCALSEHWLKTSRVRSSSGPKERQLDSGWEHTTSQHRGELFGCFLLYPSR